MVGSTKLKLRPEGCKGCEWMAEKGCVFFKTDDLTKGGGNTMILLFCMLFFGDDEE